MSPNHRTVLRGAVRWRVPLTVLRSGLRPWPASATRIGVRPRRWFVGWLASTTSTSQRFTALALGGRVTKSDVLAEVAAVKSESGRRETMSVMRRRIAEHMVASRRTSAHVHTVFDVDFSRVAELRSTKKLEYEQSGAKLTYLSFIGKAVVGALGELPIVNSSLDGHDIVYKEDINLGVAVALDWGLVVPVVKRAQEKTTIELSRCIGDLSERARTKKLKPEDVDGGTFTITNPGVFGSILGLPIINQPQVAILCVGSVEKRPVVVKDTVVPRTRAYLTLGFDHRVIDGAIADRFMNVVKRNLEHFDESLL